MPTEIKFYRRYQLKAEKQPLEKRPTGKQIRWAEELALKTESFLPTTSAMYEHSTRTQLARIITLMKEGKCISLGDVKMPATRKVGSGGRRQGAGAKKKIDAVTISITLPKTIAIEVDKLGGKRSQVIAKILSAHFEHLAKMEMDALTLD